MQDLDSVVGYWLSGIRYVWRPGVSTETSKRYYVIRSLNDGVATYPIGKDKSLLPKLSSECDYVRNYFLAIASPSEIGLTDQEWSQVSRIRKSSSPPSINFMTGIATVVNYGYFFIRSPEPVAVCLEGSDKCYRSLKTFANAVGMSEQDVVRFHVIQLGDGLRKGDLTDPVYQYLMSRTQLVVGASFLDILSGSGASVGSQAHYQTFADPASLQLQFEEYIKSPSSPSTLKVSSKVSPKKPSPKKPSPKKPSPRISPKNPSPKKPSPKKPSPIKPPGLVCTGPTCGICNSGSDCFAIVVVQALAQTPGVLDVMNTTNISTASTKHSQAQKVFMEMMTDLRTKKSVSIADFRRIVTGHGMEYPLSEMRSGQQDTGEFFTAIVQVLGIQKLFQYKTCKVMTTNAYTNVRKRISRPDTRVTLSVMDESFENALGAYLNAETFECLEWDVPDKGGFKTIRLPPKSTCTRTTSFLDPLPPILAFYITRFEDQVNDPFSIEMAFVLNGVTYELYAVLSHSGSQDSGHYYAYTKDLFDNKWRYYSDTVRKNVSEEYVSSVTDAVMLMYKSPLSLDVQSGISQSAYDPWQSIIVS